MNNYYANEQNKVPKCMPILNEQIDGVCYASQELHRVTSLSRGNFYALFSQTIADQEEPVHFDGMTGVSGLKVSEQSYITITNDGTYLISYSLTPAQSISEGDFVGIKINDNWITTSLRSLASDGIGVNSTFLYDLQEGQTIHMAVQAEKSIILQAGNANANICIVQVVSRT